MSTLASRFPSARRLTRPTDPALPPGADPLEALYHLIKPYLSWTLLEMDPNSTDILIGEPEDPNYLRDSMRELVILGGEEAQVWLRYTRKPAR